MQVNLPIIMVEPKNGFIELGFFKEIANGQLTFFRDSSLQWTHSIALEEIASVKLLFKAGFKASDAG